MNKGATPKLLHVTQKTTADLFLFRLQSSLGHIVKNNQGNRNDTETHNRKCQLINGFGARNKKGGKIRKD